MKHFPTVHLQWGRYAIPSPGYTPGSLGFINFPLRFNSSTAGVTIGYSRTSSYGNVKLATVYDTGFQFVADFTGNGTISWFAIGY